MGFYIRTGFIIFSSSGRVTERGCNKKRYLVYIYNSSAWEKMGEEAREREHGVVIGSVVCWGIYPTHLLALFVDDGSPLALSRYAHPSVNRFPFPTPSAVSSSWSFRLDRSCCHGYVRRLHRQDRTKDPRERAADNATI